MQRQTTTEKTNTTRETNIRTTRHEIIFFNKKCNQQLDNTSFSCFLFEDQQFMSVQQAYVAMKAKYLGRKDTENIWLEVVSIDSVDRLSKLSKLEDKINKKLKHNQELDDYLLTAMKQIVLAKFQQNPELSQLLLNTGGSILAHATQDQEWGIGVTEEDSVAQQPRKWQGDNIMGDILAQVRSILSQRDNKPVFSLIVAGGRNYNNPNAMSDMLDKLLAEKSKTHTIEIVSGTANGADKLGEEYATNKGYNIVRFPAHWNTHNKSAGHRRNAQMADYVTRQESGAALVFWDGESPGSKGMIDIAKRYALDVRVARY